MQAHTEDSKSAAPVDPPRKQQVALYLTPDAEEALRMTAAARRISKSELVETALRAHLGMAAVRP